jgi:hypothetical protein
VGIPEGRLGIVAPELAGGFDLKPDSKMRSLFLPYLLLSVTSRKILSFKVKREIEDLPGNLSEGK